MKRSKITRKFLEQKYDELYAQAKGLVIGLNPCGIHKDILGRTICNGIELRCSMGADYDTLCCNGFDAEPACVHLSSKGCTVKSLRCKLWFCSENIMTPLKSGIEPAIVPLKGPTSGYPNRNYLIGTASFPFLGEKHKEIFDEAEKYLFLRFFRTGKTKAIEYSYANRKRIQKNLDECSEMLSPEEYLNQNKS